MDFFLSCAYPNHVHEAAQGVSKQLKPWSIASHARKKCVTLGPVLNFVKRPKTSLGND
jgi:hypothetical protein